MGIKTLVASGSAAGFRIFLMPVDAMKTTLQVSPPARWRTTPCICNGRPPALDCPCSRLPMQHCKSPERLSPLRALAVLPLRLPCAASVGKTGVQTFPGAGSVSSKRPPAS